MQKISITIACMILATSFSTFFITFAPVASADPLIDVTATPTDNTAGVSTTYTIVFTTITPLTVAATPDQIVIIFLAGFNASAASVGGATVTQSGSDPELKSSNETIVTLDVAADEAAGTQSIVLNGIINTQTAGTAKTVSVETQDGDNTYATLDGPTLSAVFTISAGAVAILTIQTQPSATVAGAVIAPPIEIVATDTFNNVVPGASVAVMLQTGIGTLSGTTPQTTTVSGIASFDDLSIDLVGIDKVLRFSSNSQIVDSVTFTISAPDENLPPIFGSPTPSNDSANNPLNLSWSILMNDTEGDAFNWIIECNNGQNNSGIGQTNGTKSLSLTGLSYSTIYKVWVNATDPIGSNLSTRRWYVFTTEQVNFPPNTPVNLYPSNGSTGISVAAVLSWTGGDPNGDQVTYDVYFGTTNPPPKVVSNQSGVSYKPPTMIYLKIHYWKIIAWDNHSAETIGPTWHFTTKSSGDGEPPVQPENIKPVANASAGEPYHGSVNTEITFDGSRSYDADGTITQWLWIFGDNTNGAGMTIRHTYYKAGNYTVTLTVTDDDGATNIDTARCIITQTNNTPQINNTPPTKPIIYGPLSGTKNTRYNYTALSSDSDNDMLKYTFDWGDSVSISEFSGFLPNGTGFTLNHSWAAAGRYKVTVIVTDNQTTSQSSITVYIDAVQTRGAGYLLDYDGDGIYDAFNSDVSHLITAVEKQDDAYLIDGDGDGEWDYMYNTTSGITSIPLQNTPGFEMICIIGAIAMVIFWIRKRKNND